ncbi:MAG: hypothetical protein HY785_00025 [Oscillatoriophycideae cyanobacterium NC_groundwater_1537_Pr4_S-0.65um_50_18]|nr:hypothetical protein [Oscillatoriophycideae cyanobacterium NC_groundwater_1537_Pr4_S-0.65um_50_18]
MEKTIRILLQTTIPTSDDDWSIERFSLLRDYLKSLTNENGSPLCQVVARNRESDAAGNDPILSTLEHSEFDELWLFAVDPGNGVTPAECASINAFRQRGGGSLITRDHEDLGSSICNLDGVGAAHYFHTFNPDPDESQWQIDDTETTSISWPNYHSGRNGDYQRIIPVEPVHELLHTPDSPSRYIQFFPAHPHEGAVGVPTGAKNARVIAMGKSLISGRLFNLAIAFERQHDPAGNILGRAVAESTFHHFADHNWNPDMGAPSYVTEPVGDGFKREPHTLEDIKIYVRNLALWLAPANPNADVWAYKSSQTQPLLNTAR